MKINSSIISSFFLCLFLSFKAQATALDDLGFTDLSLELGAALPDGSGVTVTQVEAPDDGSTPAWIPDASGELSAKIFNDRSPGSSGFSVHATSVGTKFYGTASSSSPAVPEIDLFEAALWLGAGFLNTGAPGPLNNSIDVSTTRLANHSWASFFLGWDAEILRRVDFLIEVDDFIQVVGAGSNTTTSMVPSNSFNAIVAGRLAGGATTGTAAIDSTYVSLRAKPDIVAPEPTGSASAARVSSIAALLIDHAHKTPVLSKGSTTNRNGDTIYNAERSETIKAIVMAGADRATAGNTNVVNFTGYRTAGKQTSNGLDTRFGAGQINIYNSYHLLVAGEKDSVEDGGTTISNEGFDYDPSFGGLKGSNSTATYNFTTSSITGQKIKASLVWNLEVLSKSTDNFYNLDLQLIDVTAGGGIVVSSTSTIDNTENIWWDLAGNNNYQLKVIQGNGQSAFEWDYALAWQVVVPGVTVVESAGSTVTVENGTTDIFTVVLDSPPAGDVIIDLVSSDTSEGTVSPSSLTFTSANWSALQTVTVTGVNDALDDADINYNINFSVSSTADANYDGIGIASVAASNIDDDATFSFIDQTNVAFDTLFTSNTVVISGLLSSNNISINAGEYSINGGAYTSTAGTINNADDVTVRTTSSGIGSTPVNAILIIGDISDTFTLTTEEDTDGDGVGNSIDTDDDNDGLIDADELVLGTDPLVSDTDSDGYTDGEEVSAGSDPLNVSSIPIFPDGDINDDGLTDMGDFILAQQIIMGNIELTSTSLAHGDVAPLVNGIPLPDGLFTLGDFLVIQRKIIGEITF